jgi:methyl-accepting chemotaxis protein
MSFLSRLRLRTKLALLLGVFACGLVTTVALQAVTLHQRMLQERVDKLKAVVDMGIGFAASLEREVAAQQMTPAQAMARLREMAHTMHFDGGDGYLAVQRLDNGVVLVHGTDPSREDKPATAKDANGRPIVELLRDAVRNSDSGTITYLFPKPGQPEPQPKLSYVARFEPLSATFLAGAYIDDVESAFRSEMTALVSLGGAILLVTLAAAWLVNRDITGSLGRLQRAMAALAKGALGTEIPDTRRRDEIGEMAIAVKVFKDNAIEVTRLKAEQEAAAQHAATERKRAMAQLAGEFESSVGAIVNKVASAANEMETTAASMATIAERASSRTTAAAAASQQASTNVQAVASAAEQLSSSVAEISRQVANSAAVAAKAVGESERSNALVAGLADAAQKIGAVTNMINGIASQTNLLALNATIEAARAGEAGKGFAVVASEVKNLANQTARATEEISGQIAAMQGATADTVAAIQSIGATIGQLNEIATTIASAVEEQGAATQEIARNVHQAAAGTTEVSSNVAGVTQAVSEEGAAAKEVHGAAGELAKQAEALRGQVGRFLAEVRAA